MCGSFVPWMFLRERCSEMHINTRTLRTSPPPAVACFVWAPANAGTISLHSKVIRGTGCLPQHVQACPPPLEGQRQPRPLHAVEQGKAIGHIFKFRKSNLMLLVTFGFNPPSQGSKWLRPLQ